MSWLGDFFGGVVGALPGALIGNHSARSESQRNRDYQTYMSNTAHQREVADLKAAGLNPILAATGGGLSGASTPTGSVAHQSAPDTGSSFSSARSISSAKALQAKQLAVEYKRLELQDKELTQQIKESDSRITVNAGQMSKISAEIDNLMSQRELTAQQTHNLKTLLYAQLAEINARINQAQAEASSAYERSRLYRADKALRDIQRRLAELSIPGAESQAIVEQELGTFSRAYHTTLDMITSLVPGAEWLIGGAAAKGILGKSAPAAGYTRGTINPHAGDYYTNY